MLLNNINDIKNSDIEKKEKNVLYIELAVLVLIKLILLAVVAKFLWPLVMPKLFSNIKIKNPSFLQILGLSVILTILI
tara:strand:+ start:253 stop:486 length:234 start_codon:yes stop_codon:yes gene_type:complete